MTLDTVLNFVTRYGFVAVTAILAVAYTRFRDRTRRDTLLMFASFGVGILVADVGKLLGISSPWVAKVSGAIIIAQPYLLIAVVDQFRPIVSRVRWISAAGLAVSAALLLAGPQPLPTSATLVVLVYFMLVEGYAALELFRAGRTLSGIPRNRIRLIGQGTMMLVLVILLAGIQMAVPARQATIQPISRVLSLLCAIWYYLGFTPPVRLRWIWQLEELYDFLRRLAGRPAEAGVASVSEVLCAAATRAAGGLASLVLLADRDQLTLRATDRPKVQIDAISTDAGPLAQSWRSRSAAILRDQDLTGALASSAASLGATVALAVPIASRERAWGLLLVFQRRTSLHPQDDLRVLGLLCDHTALVLDVGRLLTEQRSLIERLDRSGHDLEAANKELESFAYSVSHDLRAPLRAIDGFSRIVMEDHAPALDQDGRGHLERIRAATQRMALLIDDLLNLSRLTRAEMRREPVDLTGLAHDVETELRQSEPQRKIEVVIADGMQAVGDPHLLRAALHNLLGNAWKFTGRRDRARVEVGTQHQNGERAYFIRDNGAGFDMSYAGKLFGAFQRLHGTADFPGTGIGLATVQRIIHRHGGRIWATGEVDKGATFYFTLPWEHAPEDGARRDGRA